MPPDSTSLTWLCGRSPGEGSNARCDGEDGRGTRRRSPLPLTPAVSILVAAYNEQETVVDAAASLLAQRYPSFELVIVDDGSTDETAARLIDAYGLQRVDRPPAASSPTGR